jgi:1-acyl-sn-glycerol-3-phosphate acyltransferase
MNFIDIQSSMSWIQKVWRWSTAGFFSYLSWIIINLLLLFLFLPLTVLYTFGVKRAVRFVLTTCLRLYFLHLLPLFGLYRIHGNNDIALVRTIRNGLVVVNHTSWLDALVVLALIPNVRPLVSTRYGRVPLVSTAMRWLGCIFIDRRNRQSVAIAVNDIRVALRSNIPVAVFPEGTRSPIGELGPFQEVFFSLAVEEDAVLEPILLLLDIPFLGPGTENFVTPRAANLQIRKLSPIRKEARERGRDLAFRTRKVMRTALKDRGF